MIRKLSCIYGWPRSGTTSIAAAVNRSDLYAIWIEKDIFASRSFETLDELLAAVHRPGASSQLARTFNRERVAIKNEARILGEKTTWLKGLKRQDALSGIHGNLTDTAASIGIDWEMVICLREPASWIAAWAMTHLIRTRGPDRGFWSGPMDDRDLRSFVERAMTDYAGHLERVESMAGDPRIYVRCLERADSDLLDYRFEFTEFLEHAAPGAFQSREWSELLVRRKADLTERYRGQTSSGKRYERLLGLHRPYPVEFPDGSSRRI
jgi:hypothetical protein